MKKILILLPGPFLKRDYERFGIDTLKKNFLVKAIDCTSWTHPELWKEYSKIVFKCKEQVVISCKRDFLTLLSQINPVIVIDSLHSDKKTNWMRQQIKKNKKNLFNEIKNFERIIQTNLNGAYYLSQLLKQKLSKSNRASIINISSISAHQGALANPGYVSSKTAILGLTRALANDYGSNDIRVNSISLGYFKTPMTIKSHKLKKRRKIISSRMIISRWGEPKDLFGLVEYLISERASYITGQDFVVDGGWLAKGL